MKKLARKFLAMLLTAAIAVSGMVMTTVSAGAKGIADMAVELDAMELVSRNFEKAGESEYYKITMKKDGELSLRFSELSSIRFRLMDSTGGELKSEEVYRGISYSRSYELSKGTYYLSVAAYYDGGNISDFYYSCTPSKKPTASFSVTIKKGSTLQLGSVTENYDGKVKWLSTKKTIATVSDKGLVTAKKAGTTYIRAQLDTGDYIEIKVVVKK